MAADMSDILYALDESALETRKLISGKDEG
jgi:hypothetical protein